MTDLLDRGLMSSRTVIRFGIIGCGLMGKEFASAASRWCHLVDKADPNRPLSFQPKIVAICDVSTKMFEWFLANFPGVSFSALIA